MDKGSLKPQHDNEGRLFVRSSYLVDEHTNLGLPYTLTKKHLSQGWSSRRSSKPDTNVWVEIDLESPARINGVRLFPATRFDNRHVKGFGFPENFKIEAIFADPKQQPKLLVDYTQKKFNSPGHNPVTLRFDPVVAKSIRLTATRLWAPRNDAFYHLAFSEFQVLLNERNLAEDKPVYSIDRARPNFITF